MNKINNSLYLMNNKDICILINKSDIKSEFIIGIDLLWDLLLVYIFFFFFKRNIMVLGLVEDIL